MFLTYRDKPVLTIASNKTKVIRADLLDFDFDFDLEDIFTFSDISVLVSFQF